MPVKVREGHPMLSASRVMKSFAWNGRAGWIQVCDNAMAHYYAHGKTTPLCGASVTFQKTPRRGVPVPACKACIKAGARYGCGH